MTRYIHVRPGQTYDAEHGLQGTPSLKGGYTIAYQIAADGSNVTFHVAYCNPGDNYSRKMGRLIAKGRLDKLACPVIPLAQGTTPAEAILTYLHAEL